MDFTDVLENLLRPGGTTAGAADIVTLIGSALGLGFLSGFRLYATVLALGLAIRFHWFTPNESMAALHVLGDWKVLGAAGVLAAVEFLADKIPWVDSAWDSLHTFIRPLAAVAMASTALGGIDPVGKAIIALLCGGVAFTTHSAKAATRFAVNHSPEPFSNWMLSVAEDLAAPAALWFISAHPGIFLGLLAVFLVAMAVVLPRLLRQVRLEWAALRSLVGSWFGVGPGAKASLHATAAHHPKARALWNLLHPYIDDLPEETATKMGVVAGVRAAATKSVTGLNRSLGFVCLREKKITFVARRWFKSIAHSIPYTDIKNVSLKPGFFLDQLVIEDLRGNKVGIDLFKVAPNQQTAGIKLEEAAPQS